MVWSMQKFQLWSAGRCMLLGLLAVSGVQTQAQQPIGRTSATEVKVSGAVDISHGETLLGNGSDITAGNQAVKIALQRGGSLQLCSTSNVYLAKDGAIDDKVSSALMIALERGAVEANYAVGKYSDVLMTPDLRILISGPGQANLSIRVNTRGDTCVDNHGVDAPYVTVSNQLEGGAYRVMPNQRVSFQHGSLLEVVDHEPEPCGCPGTLAVPANSTATTADPGTPDRKVGGPSSTPADTAFPIAQSEGLAPPPHPPTTPVVPVGQAHAEVSAPLVFNGETPPPPTQPATPTTSALPAETPATNAAALPAAATAVPAAPAREEAPQATPPQEVPAQETLPATAPQPTQATVSRPPGAGGFFHSIGHFFSKIFGK
jgi:hypothetical protein